MANTKATQFAEDRERDHFEIYSAPPDEQYGIILNKILSSEDRYKVAHIIAMLSQPHRDKLAGKSGKLGKESQATYLTYIKETQNNPRFNPHGKYGKIICKEQSCATRGCGNIVPLWQRELYKEGCRCVICPRCSNDHFWAHQTCINHGLADLEDVSQEQCVIEDVRKPTQKKRKAEVEGKFEEGDVPSAAEKPATIVYDMTSHGKRMRVGEEESSSNDDKKRGIGSPMVAAEESQDASETLFKKVEA